jgi:hypothetical protein
MTFSESFFEVTAQLIPVLFLAVIVEERLQPASDESAMDRVARSWLLVLLVIGEMLALAVVAGGLSPSRGTGSIVVSTLLLSVFLLALPVIERELTQDRSRPERVAHLGAGLAVILAVFWILLAVQFG